MRYKQLTWSPPGFSRPDQWTPKFAKKPRSQHFSGFSSKMGVANSAVMTCPQTLTHQLKRVTACCIAWETDNFEIFGKPKACLVVTRWVVYTSSNTAFTLWPGLATARNSASFTLWNRASEPKCMLRSMCSLLSMRTMRARGCRTMLSSVYGLRSQLTRASLAFQSGFRVG